MTERLARSCSRHPWRTLAAWAVAAFLDATIIRSIVLPSVLALLDGRTWYLPRWLGWLPHVEVEHPQRAEAAAPASGSPA